MIRMNFGGKRRKTKLLPYKVSLSKQSELFSFKLGILGFLRRTNYHGLLPELKL